MPDKIPIEELMIQIWDDTFDDGRECRDCLYAKDEIDMEDYGDRRVRRITRTCTLRDEDVKECPGVERYMKDNVREEEEDKV